jgi:hypothetical protein
MSRFVKFGSVIKETKKETKNKPGFDEFDIYSFKQKKNESGKDYTLRLIDLGNDKLEEWRNIKNKTFKIFEDIYFLEKDIKELENDLKNY